MAGVVRGAVVAVVVVPLSGTSHNQMSRIEAVTQFGKYVRQTMPPAGEVPR